MLKSCLFFIFIFCSLNVNSEKVYFADQLPCLSYANNLSIIASDFLQCALSNSRPLTICENCIKFYLKFQEVYDLMASVKIYFIFSEELIK